MSDNIPKFEHLLKLEKLPTDAYELVQVHKCGDKIEVIVRNKNKYEAFGGLIGKYENPKEVYPPDYIKEN